MPELLRILYIDDDPDLLEIGKNLLEQSGQFSVDTITSAPDAPGHLKGRSYHAVISDYQMRGMNGIELLQAVRSSGNPVPFIIFTGRGSEEVVIQAINEGADFYLQKGGDLDAQFAELAHKVRIAVEKQQAVEKIQVLNRLYPVLYATSKAVFHTRSKKEFFYEICRILVERGGFRMAWFGLADHERKIIRPVAHAGHTDGYLDTISISVEDIPEGRGPTGTAYREEQCCFSNDIRTDPRMEPWREDALKRQYLASAAVPFALGTKNAGVLSIYAPVTGFFDSQIIGLLEELASDISFCLRTIDDREERVRALEELNKSDANLKRAEEIGNSGSWEFHLGKDEVTLSDGARRIYGLDEPRWTIEEIQKIPLPGYHRLLDMALKDLITGHSPYNVEFKIRRQSDGNVRDIHSIAEYDPANNVVFGVLHDITERTTAENERKSSERKFRAAFEASPHPMAITDISTGMILDINHAFEEWSGHLQEEIAGKTTRELNIWANPEERDDVVRLLNTNGRVHKKEVKLRRKNGEIRDILFTAVVFGIESQNYMLSLAEDLTEQKRLEEVLRKTGMGS